MPLSNETRRRQENLVNQAPSARVSSQSSNVNTFIETLESENPGMLIPDTDSNEGAMAIQDGGPLQIPATAPKTLTEAFQETVKLRGTRGLRFLEVDGRQTFLSYAELEKNALRILTGLRSKGLKAKDRVILQIDSYPKHFSTLWACILGGITPVTVAIAPSYEEKNGVTSKVINTWKLLERPTILTSESLMQKVRGLEKVFEEKGLSILSVDELERHETAKEIYHPQPSDLVFFQLTSGSTGIPKCIQETHKGIIAHIQAGIKFNGYGPQDITFNWLPLDHVVPTLTWHLRDVYHGCEQIHARPDLVLSNPLKWLDVMDEYRVTQAWAPNFGFKLVADQLKKEKQARNWDLSSIQFFMNAGEQVTMPVVSEFLAQTKKYGVRENMMQPAFGMAEVCTCMTYANNFSIKTGSRRFLKSSLRGKLQAAEGDDSTTTEFVSLGPPVPGVQIRIADAENCLVQEGVIGRFQIKGDVVTPGYLNNEAANKEAFVGNGWFNSGDLGFILDGELYLTGREKEMIIVRGANFYCYEIEDVVNSVPGVTPTFTGTCSVADPKTGSESLAIFFVPLPEFDGKEAAREIKRRVAANLGLTAGFVVPLKKSEFPKTTSGKIQRTQLKKNLEGGVYDELLRQLNSQSQNLTLPESAMEKAVADIWSEVLQHEKVGMESNFFDLGGDSLRGMQVLSRVREVCGVELQFSAFFAGDSSLAAFCRKIEAGSKAGKDLQPILRRGSATAPLSFPQQRIWLMEQLTPGTSLYNVTRSVWLNGAIQKEILEKAIENIVKRHDVLRSVFLFEKGQPIQKCMPFTSFSLPATELTGSPAERREKAMAIAVEQGSELFDLEKGPLFRASLIKTGEKEHLLTVCFHQIVVDGWSMGVFFDELSAEYEALSQNKTANISLPIQYADFAKWQAETSQDNEKQLSYWKKQLSGVEPKVVIKGAGKNQAGIEARTETLVVNAEIAGALKRRAQAEGATNFMVLLAAYKALLNHYSGQEDLSVGTAIANRNRTEIENLIGFFVNTLALRTQVKPQDTTRDLIRKTRETCLNGFENAALPFEKIVQQAGVPSRPGESPFFDVWFSVFDEMPPFKVGEAKAQTCHIPPSSAQFPLALFIVENGDSIICHFEYRTAVFETVAVKKMVADFIKLLEALANEPSKTLQEIFAGLSPVNTQPSLASARRKVVAK